MQILYSASETIELKHGRAQNIDSQVNDLSAGEVTHQSVNEQNKLANERIIRQIERLCALLADRTELKTSGTSEATGSLRGDATISSAESRYDKTHLQFFRTIST